MNYKVIVEILLDINPVPFSFYKNFEDFDNAHKYKDEVFNEIKQSILNNELIIVFETNLIVRVENIIKVNVRLIDMHKHAEIL